MTAPSGPGRLGGRRNLRDRLAPCPGPVRELHTMVLRRFLETGSAPTRRWICQAASELGLDASAVGELAAADAMHIADDVVSVAYPLAGRPTRHRVELDGAPAVYAMCATDALGIPPMTGRDGRIISTDPRDGQPIEVAVHDGTWSWSPAGAVVVVGHDRQPAATSTSSVSVCPNSNFHVSRDSAEAYLVGHRDIDGEILDQQTAIDRARDNFGPILGRTALIRAPRSAR